MLKEKIEKDLQDALRSKDKTKADALRMLKSRIKNEEIAAQKTLNDEDIISAVSSEIKKRKDSVSAYVSGNRPELAEKEQMEIEILKKYMPQQLSEQEVIGIIEETLKGKGFGPSDFGKAMGILMPKVKGKAEGGLVSKLLKEKLEN